MTGHRRRVDYNDVAATFDARYAYYAGPAQGIGAALSGLARDFRARRILEVGCGTGHWLHVLASSCSRICGLDPSLGMLRKAAAPHPTIALVAGVANALPWRPESFDLVFCVNAFHHFDDLSEFVGGASRLLAPEGALAVMGMDPHAGGDHLYLYDYFPGTYETDLARYPSSGTIMDWMIRAGFSRVEWRVVETVRATGTGRRMLGESMLQKNATSQLTLLSDEEYESGLARIRGAIERAEAAGEEQLFPVDISFHMVVGRLNVGSS